MIEKDKIYNTDCMDVLSKIDDSCIDLTILDPNYEDWDGLCKRGLISQAVRVTKPTGNILMFTKQPFDFNLRNEVNDIFRREIIWTFCNGGAWVSNKMPLVSFQKIFWCTVSNDFFFNERTGLGYSWNTKNFKRANKVFGGYNEDGKDFSMSDDGIWLRDHLHYEKPNFGSIPSKPIELLTILIRCFCEDGGTILNPFMGSGNVEIACIREKRHFIGIELDKAIFEKSEKRIRDERSELSLF